MSLVQCLHIKHVIELMRSTELIYHAHFVANFNFKKYLDISVLGEGEVGKCERYHSIPYSSRMERENRLRGT